MGAPYYYAEVDSTETTFGPEHLRYDRVIFSALGGHAEGEKPQLTLEVLNTGEGILAPGRKVWAWFAHTRRDNGHVEPIFFGRIYALPKDIIGRVYTIKLIAEPLDYLEQKQLQAEPLKVRPNYDPVFYDPAHRDNPEAILSGYPMQWHVGRVPDPVTHTLPVTPSHILVGEEGVAVFDRTDSFYDSIKVTPGQAPLSSVNVDATIQWRQQDVGLVDIGQRTYFSYMAGGIIEQWPKPEQSLGGGYFVHSSVAADTYGINTAITASWTFNYKNPEKTHMVGDTMSLTYSVTDPVLATPMLRYTTLVKSVAGFIDELDFENPDRPTSSYSAQYFIVPLGRADTSLVVRYEADRQRSERVMFTVRSNVQQVLSSSLSPPLPAQETITISGMNVGERLENVLDWLSVKGQAVALGQVIYPDNPTVPGGTSYQIATTAGIAGTGAEPEFSPIVGEQTADGSVVWTSLGTTLGVSSPDWTATTFMPIGTVVRPLEPLWAPWTILVPLPRVIGTNVNIGEYCQASNGAFQICTLPGTTGRQEPGFGATYGAVTVDGTAQWTCVGTELPSGDTYFVATAAGTTSDVVPPNWDFTIGADTNENAIVWKSLGVAGDFVQIPIGDPRRRSYITTDRGQWSLEYLVCLACNKLAKRSRSAKVNFDCIFDRAVELSCRMNAQISDGRIPGGIALGKITYYEFRVNGDTREEMGSVQIECAIGRGLAVVDDPGTPSYVDDGYVAVGYQYYYGNVVALPEGNVGYSIPLDAPNDDGLTFPLDRDQVVKVDKIWGDLPSQVTAINAAALLLQQEALVSLWASATAGPVSVMYQQQLAALSRTTVDSLLQPSEIWQEWEFAPLNNGPFNTDYQVLTTLLELPKQIDLEAAAVP